MANKPDKIARLWVLINASLGYPPVTHLAIIAVVLARSHMERAAARLVVCVRETRTQT